MTNGGEINPAMIALARESRGWTQQNLADATGLSQAKICKYESGLQEVLPDDASLMADALNYDYSLLRQQDPVYSIESAAVFHRKRSKITVREQKRIQAETNIRRMQVAALLRGASVYHDRNFFPSISLEDFGGSVASAAQWLRQLWRAPDGPIHNLTGFVEAAGGIVVLADFGTNLVDGLHTWTSGLPPIFIMNRNVPGERYRFSLAHEIGHAVLHHLAIPNDVEDEANRFAAELLLPRSSVRDDLRNFNLESAARLKRAWKVSMQFLIMRAFQLQQISDAKRRRLFMQLGARGQRTIEPFPIELESPRVLDDLIAMHRETLGLSADELRSLLFTDTLGSMEKPGAPNARLRLTRQDEALG